MAGRVAPYIDNTGLVFAYDQANIVRSYLGEPTTNLATNTPSQGGWPGSYTVVDSVTKTFDFTTSTVEWGGDASWTTFYYDVSAYTGQYVTISATFEYASDPNKFNFLWIGQTSGSETYLGYSPEADRNQKTTDDREDITWSGIVGSGGKVGILIWMSNGTSTTVTARISNVQVEVKSHATPFVNGTRSVTQGLKDLTGRSTIDLSNVSFDSNAQMTFDGTDDYASLGTVPLAAGASTYTIEAMFRADSTKTQVIWEQNSSAATQHQRACMLLLSNGVGGFNGESNDFHSAVPYSTGVWYHWTITVNKNAGTNPIKVYTNGALYAQGDSSSGASNLNVGTHGAAVGYKLNSAGENFDGDIHLLRVYNRVLLASEIQQNFNAVRGRYGI